jgi:hypothetical protein
VHKVKEITTFSASKLADIFKKAFALRFTGKKEKVPEEKYLTGRVKRVRHICDLPDKRVEEAQILLDRPISKAILDVGSSIAITPHNSK